MTLAETLTALEGCADLTAGDAMTFRRLVFGAGEPMTQAIADRLFRLNDGTIGVSKAWRSVFVETLTDFVLRQGAPSGHLTGETADWLMSKISAREIIRQDVVELLIRVLEETQSTPWSFAEFVLLLIKDIILWNHLHHRPVCELDVERLRRVLFAQGGEGQVRVSRVEADALFDLHDAFGDAAAPQNWSPLFVQAVAAAAVFEAIERTGTVSAAPGARGDTTLTIATNDDGRLPQAEPLFGSTADAQEIEPEHWLISRLGPGPLDDTGRAILLRLAQKSGVIEPRLGAFLRQEGVSDQASHQVRLRA